MHHATREDFSLGTKTTRPKKTNHSTHNLESTTTSCTLKPRAMLEDLSKTRSLVSLFILVVLRWIESRSRPADGGMHSDRVRDCRYDATLPRGAAEDRRNQTRVLNSFNHEARWTRVNRLPQLGRNLKFVNEWTDFEADIVFRRDDAVKNWRYWWRTLILSDILGPPLLFE